MPPAIVSETTTGGESLAGELLVVETVAEATMRSFTFAILLGILFGTYCTLFVTTPIAYEIAKRRREKAASK